VLGLLEKEEGAAAGVRSGYERRASTEIGFRAGTQLRRSAAAGRRGSRVEQRQLVERLLGELEEKDQIMLVMKEVEGFSVEEIGEVLGLNVNTVK